MSKQREQDRINDALRWPGLPEPERLPVPEAGGHVEGWDFNEYAHDVFEAWTEAVAHGRGPYPKDRSTRSASQRSRRVYATERDALIALRHALSRQYAKNLARVDAQIDRSPA
jgi:hypothetical protein